MKKAFKVGERVKPSKNWGKEESVDGVYNNHGVGTVSVTLDYGWNKIRVLWDDGEEWYYADWDLIHA